MNRIRNEPAIVVGLLTSIVAELEAVLSSGATTWRDFVVRALPAVAGVVIRHFVTPYERPNDNTQEFHPVR